MITQLDYPVTGSVGTYQNIFPSHQALNVNFARKDVFINSIASGTGGVVELTLSAALDGNIAVGDFIVWESDGYSLRTSRILDIISPTVIEVDEVFTSSDATNGFVNYRKNWFLEARFVAKDTPTDQQANVELVINDFSQVPSSLEGLVSLDLSVIRDVLSADFSLQSEIVDNLFKEFKFQFRESYETNRDAAWVSPNPDLPIMLVMASKPVVFNDFINSDQFKFIQDYPLVTSYIYSDINDNGSNTLTFSLSQYTLSKSFISSFDVISFTDQSGLINLFIDPSTLDPAAVFIKFEVEKTTNNAQYDPSQYDPSQYA